MTSETTNKFNKNGNILESKGVEDES